VARLLQGIQRRLDDGEDTPDRTDSAADISRRTDGHEDRVETVRSRLQKAWSCPGTRARVLAGVTVLAVLSGCGSESPLDPAPHYACYRVADPYAVPGGFWQRGNFHMHSTHSDGAMDAGKLVDLYARNGFSVLCISDHNEYGDQDGGILPAYQTDSLLHDWNGDGQLFAEHVFGSGVEAYVRDYAKAQESWKRDPWYCSDVVEAPVLISGAEMTRAGWHIGVLGLPPGPLAPPNGDQGYMQQARAVGGLVFLAHPGEWNDSPGRLASKLDLSLFEGIEIMNGLRLAAPKPRTGEPEGGMPQGDRDCLAGNPVPDATPLWDGLLSRGHRLWGFANDDAHTWEGAPDAYPFTAFDMILTQERSTEAFLAALHGGAFYGSTGLYFRELGARSDSVLAWAPEADRIRFIGWGGRVLLDSDAPRVAYRVQGDEGYVRVEATAAPRDKAWPRQAWSQPFFIEPVTCSPAAAGRNSQ
jgi:hypothetical protein